MGLITITSDLGTKDFYLSVIKGQILSLLPEAQIIDVSHHIEKYNISQAAFVVKNTLGNFPKNTVHFINVGVNDMNEDYVVVKHQEQYYLSLDNGLLSLVFANEPIIAYKLNITAPPELFSFPAKAILVQAATHLARGGVPEVIGEPIGMLRQAMDYQPVVQPNLIRAAAIYIDDFGNVITNVTKELFLKHQMGRQFEISFRNLRNLRITKISQQYADVDEGDPLVLFNASGHLEIAIRSGKASGLLGLNITSQIPIEFI